MDRASTRTAVRRAYANTPNGQVHYRRSGPDGTRSPLLLLHPFPGTGALFESFMAEMGRDRTVIAPDFPGYGMSDAPAAPPAIAGYAAAILELEAALAWGVFDVIGYHGGGSVALEMARQSPNSVRKIITIGAPIMPAEERADIGARFTTLGPDDRAASFATNWPFFKTAFWKMGPDPVQAWNIYLEAQKSPEITAWGMRATIAYDFAAALEAVSQPLLILNPDDDLAEMTPRAAASLKNGRIHDLPQWTHGMLDARTAEIAAIVRSFLDQ